jgi:RNA polymerase sigma factor, sigma-70 family
MITDEELIRQIRAGDEEAADILVKRYYTDILRYCKRHIIDQNLAEDATQETFYRVFRSLMRYQDKERFRAWLYMIARNICIDENRKQKNTIPLGLEDIGEESNEIHQIENSDEIEQLLSVLPEEQREAILLYFEDELTYKEIGKILGIPARTVQSRVKNGIKAIKKRRK